MPPLQVDQQTGQTNNSSSSYYGGYDSSGNYDGSSGSSNYDTVQGAQQQVAAYDKYIADLKAALAASEGSNDKWRRDQLEAQMQDAQKARDNAYKIAQLQSETTRYGYDQQRQTAIDQLKENQRQYDSTHALDLKKYGLEVAKAYTQYASTPDQVFALNDFKSALNRTGQGQAAQNVLTSEAGTPHAKTWQDFAALSGYDDLSSVSSGTTSSGSGGTTYSASSTGGGADSGGNATTSTDQRQTAINAVTKAMPASDTEGHDEQDWAALNAIKSLYFARKPGTVAALGAQRQKTALAGLSRLGYDSAQVQEDYDRSLPGQQSVRAA